MKYKNYEAAVRYDEEAEVFYGEVINTRDVITFQGKSVEELKQEFESSVEDYLEFCRQRGEEPDKPFSGDVVLHISPELHHRLYTKAKRNSKTLKLLLQEDLASI